MNHYHFQHINRKEIYGETKNMTNEDSKGHLINFGEKEKKSVGDKFNSVFLDKEESDSTLKKRVNKLFISKTLKQQNKKKKTICEKTNESLFPQSNLDVANSVSLDESVHEFLDSKKVPCPYCSKVLSTRCVLNRHIKLVHYKYREYNCPNINCNTSSGTRSDLRTHIKNCHEKIEDSCF